MPTRNDQGPGAAAARDELAAVTPGLAHQVRGPIGKYRWTICALLFFATSINHLDRQVTGVLGPTLQKEFGWTETQYANITSWWTAAYAIGFLFVGRFIDRVGVRIGFAVAVVVWSLAAAGHALAASVVGFGIAYISALAIVHLLAPRMQRVEV